MKLPHTEILLNFMFNAINRFISLPELRGTLTELFGTDKWEQATALDGDERESFILNTYREQVKKISKYAFPFCIQFPTKKRTFFYLIHMSNHWKACSIMKACFAKHHHGRFQYLGTRGKQLSLSDIESVKVGSIKRLLVSKYRISKMAYIDLLEQHADDEFLESSLKEAIKEMEREGDAYIERYPLLTEKKKQLRKSVEPNDLIYFGSFPFISRKSLLYKTKVEYGNFTINHVLGCAHGCNFPCYARMMAMRYGWIKSYDDWLHPRLVGNALDLLDSEIPQYRKDIDFVHMSFTTDPFMYDAANQKLFGPIKNLTLKIIEKLNKHRIKVTTLTKGVYPEELFDTAAYGAQNEYGITLVSLNPAFLKEYEPFAAPVRNRIESLRALHEKGLKTWVSIEPYPTPNLVDQDLRDILNMVDFVDTIIFGKMNYNKAINGYADNDEFYRKCAREVSSFCQGRDIRYHIKVGTPGSDTDARMVFSGCGTPTNNALSI